MGGQNSGRIALPAGYSRVVQSRLTPQILQWPAKYNQEVLDFSVNFALRLTVPPAAAGDTIVSSIWNLVDPPDEGLVIGANSYTDLATTIWLSQGALGSLYALMNVVTTEQGRTLEEVVFLRVRNNISMGFDCDDEPFNYVPLMGT